MKWKVIRNRRDRETPCCHQPVRVKINEPGVQSRKCDLCHTVNYFVLEEGSSNRWDGMLFMRWITEAEAKRIQAGMAEGDELAIGLDLNSLIS